MRVGVWWCPIACACVLSRSACAHTKLELRVGRRGPLCLVRSEIWPKPPLGRFFDHTQVTTPARLLRHPLSSTTIHKIDPPTISATTSDLPILQAGHFQVSSATPPHTHPLCDHVLRHVSSTPATRRLHRRPHGSKSHHSQIPRQTRNQQIVRRLQTQ